MQPIPTTLDESDTDGLINDANYYAVVDHPVESEGEGDKAEEEEKDGGVEKEGQVSDESFDSLNTTSTFEKELDWFLKESREHQEKLQQSLKDLDQELEDEKAGRHPWQEVKAVDTYAKTIFGDDEIPSWYYCVDREQQKKDQEERAKKQENWDKEEEAQKVEILEIETSKKEQKGKAELEKEAIKKLEEIDEKFKQLNLTPKKERNCAFWLKYSFLEQAQNVLLKKNVSSNNPASKPIASKDRSIPRRKRAIEGDTKNSDLYNKISRIQRDNHFIKKGLKELQLGNKGNQLSTHPGYSMGRRGDPCIRTVAKLAEKDQGRWCQLPSQAERLNPQRPHIVRLASSLFSYTTEAKARMATVGVIRENGEKQIYSIFKTPQSRKQRKQQQRSGINSGSFCVKSNQLGLSLDGVHRLHARLGQTASHYGTYKLGLVNPFVTVWIGRELRFNLA